MADEASKPMVAPITVERSFRVGGKKVVCHVTFPAAIAKEIGLENMYLCAQRVLVRLDSKDTKIQEMKLGE
ncbi:MAG TPA: hypothetical protein VGB18_04860 [Candidatus Thermoplasmatota archaeon]